MGDTVELKDIKQDEQNANRHTERGEYMLRRSMEKFGFLEAGTLDKNNKIIGGNFRTEVAADALEADDAIVIDVDGTKPVYIRRRDMDLSTPEGREAAVALNRTAQVSIDFDPVVLADFDLGGVELEDWFTADELETDFGIGKEEPQDAEPQISRADELREQWGTELGQLWRLPSRTPGQEHRLICGDCMDAGVVEMLVDGGKFDMMFTDPPYGVDYRGGHFHSGDVNIVRKREGLSGDRVDCYGGFLPVVKPYIDGPCYVWFASTVGKPVFDAIIGNGYELHAMIVWHKTNAKYAAMNAQYKQRHEPCMYFKPKGSTLRWVGPTDECTVWEMPRDAVNDLHPTQKPIHLAERAIGNHDAVTVADFFVGSGTTIIAAENLSRQCRAVEISPAYVAVALQRYVDAFGIEPELFSEI